MADNIINFPIGKSAPFQNAADIFLKNCYPDLTKDERSELKAKVVDIADRYEIPKMELKFPAEMFSNQEQPGQVKQAIEAQLLPPFHKVFNDMLTEIFFLQCYSFSLERAQAKKQNASSPASGNIDNRPC